MAVLKKNKINAVDRNGKLIKLHYLKEDLVHIDNIVN